MNPINKQTKTSRKNSSPDRVNSGRRGNIGIGALLGSALIGSAITAVLLTAGFARSGINADTFRQLDLFGEVFELVNDNYVTPPETKDVIEGAIDGMLMSLDPHSSYLSPDDFVQMQEQTRGSFAGLGIQVTMDNKGRGRGLVRVVSPIDETPAARAGIEANDLIYEIDGKPVFGLTLDEAITRLKGPRGTPVDIKIFRESADEPIELTLVRDIVTVNPVLSRIERDNVGYVRVTSFTDQTTSKMLAAIREMDREISGGVKGLVLDLRNNPGGLLDQAVAVSDAFLEGGEIVSTRGRNPKDTIRELGTPGDILNGRPVIVLINAGSASASEIVAGALQDRNRGLLLGTKSFGKGSVQTVLPLQNGINGALRLTTARYYTPAGRSIQQLGIVPDIVAPVTREGQDPEDATDIRSEADLTGALDIETLDDLVQRDEEGHVEAKDTSILVEPIVCPLEEDCQLNRALDILQDGSEFRAFLAQAGEVIR
jgi:carboxyl-terminal processing protease